MAEDPYAPPKATVADTGGDRHGSFVKAILIGLAVDIGGTFAAGIVLTILVGIAIGGDPEALAALFSESFLLKAAMMTIGGGCTVLGGYVAARIANRTELNVALMFGICSLVAGELLSLGMGDQSSALEHTVFLVVTIPAAIFGGWLRKRGKRHAAVEQ
ncbi:MAG: hypothetical protein ACREUW_07305 [Burkholderiales bacterium]